MRLLLSSRATVVAPPAAKSVSTGGRGGGRRGPAATPVELTRSERRQLQAVLRRERTELALARRAQVVLALDADPKSCVSAVADQQAAGDRKYVRTWRDRYHREGVAGLKTRRRPGRPRWIGPMSRCQVVAMACGKPA